MEKELLMAKINEWQRAKQSATVLANQERELRKEILEAQFGVGISGSRKAIFNGLLIKGNFGIEHKIDSKSFESAIADDAIPDECMDGVRTKYELDKKGYDSLSDEAKAILDDYITSKPSLPTLEIKILDEE